MGRRSSISRSPSRSRPRSSRARRRDSFSSRSSSGSPSRSDKSRKSQLKDQIKDKTTTTSGLKTSLVFLGSVAAATYAAHKYWPKGVTYGDKEDWELEKEIKKEKAKKNMERHGNGDYYDGPSRRADDRLPLPPPNTRRRDRDYERPRSTHGVLGIEGPPPRRRGTPELDEIIYVRRPSANRSQAERLSTMSQVSGSRTGDVRRAQYVEDNRTVHADRRSHATSHDERDFDYQNAQRYVATDPRPRRYSFDEPSDPRRSDRIIYTGRNDNYR
ncbi:hypothetical protein PFICI_05290 [Pestalotiopsis fici W106-1]|uniref:Uncharacterized protein n=1 Tax=Pestalotiopsis fici (strain W106-1 / CGMCC3.15140) TaxID=1229662 RepID=W3XBL0_PESFW|nr:uncharacterized protein PFICI_05290 [Pestalotiopsis fici W106-1]ETS83414.1 hypothetical protein PFICI_05290 [Pestalotiopsis fici W106-1]